LYPWGDAEPGADRLSVAHHRVKQVYSREEMPLVDVNIELGLSPFGLRHMAGNVWNWCRDWFDERFYDSPKASMSNAVNKEPAKSRSERGGSWVGPADLAQSSFRRGRAPIARGRCLGFRCVK
jgi:sulfatase modifying factor 1